MDSSDGKAERLSGSAGGSEQATPRQRSGAPSEDYIQWLESRSMRYQAVQLSALIAGSSRQWRNPYGHPRSKEFVTDASVWFTSYAAATIGHADKSVVQTLGDQDLLSTFQDIGIEGIHTGPMRRAGGITGRQ